MRRLGLALHAAAQRQWSQRPVRALATKVPGEADIFCCQRDGGYKIRCAECPLPEQDGGVVGNMGKKAAAVDAARRTLGLSEEDFDCWILGLRPNLVKERFRERAKEAHPGKSKRLPELKQAQL